MYLMNLVWWDNEWLKLTKLVKKIIKVTSNLKIVFKNCILQQTVLLVKYFNVIQ